MEKERRTAENHPRRNSTPGERNVSRTKFLQINEDDALRLVGRIVEKGISEDKSNLKPFSTTAPPKPSVLPFPVARHRSHGPLWKPPGNKTDDDYENEDCEDDEEDAFFNADQVAAFAKSVEKRQKKGLDLSKWKELVSGGGATVTDRSLKIKSSLVRKGKQNNNVEAVGNQGKTVSTDNPIPLVDMVDAEPQDEWHSSSKNISELDHAGESGNAMDVDFRDGFRPQCTESPVNMTNEEIAKSRFKNSDNRIYEIDSAAMGNRSVGLGKDYVSESLKSEIDAENQARLRNMSPEEIAEAQAELIQKTDPALINMLKKRGQDKLKRQKHPSLIASMSKTFENVKTEDKSNRTDIYSHLENQMEATFTSKSADTKVDKYVERNSGSDRTSFWNAWTERVEAVRDMRFSLDGGVVENGFIPPEIGNGERRHDADSAAERDFLRTEGEPEAAGYTIKEAVALTRSAVPGQRSIALHLLSSVLDKALHNICRGQLGSKRNKNDKTDKTADWEAVWAYILGPEPELVLALRMALDDNHSSVVLACAKVIQCALSYNLNEVFFEISEKIPAGGKGTFTAPVFRSKPDIDIGFLRGGFWKYSAKPSNVFPPVEENLDDEDQDKHTIRDDIFLAGQDFAAGLVRMGILPRIQYLLETEHTLPLEECIISILVALARHSPTCAKAVMQFPNLVQTVVNSFTSKTSMEVCPSQIKTVCLLKVLAQADRKNCLEILRNGAFQGVTWHLYQYNSSLDSWVKSGRDNCKPFSALMVEQLRLWKVCIQNSLAVSYFPELFPALCLWLNPPSFETLMEKDLLCEFCSISKEAYLVLEALSGTLPNICFQKLPNNQSQDGDHNGIESWSWSYVGPMVDLAIKWISLASKLFQWNSGIKIDIASATPLLWVYSALLHMISGILAKVRCEDTASRSNGDGEPLPWLPEFVPRIGLEIINSGLLSFSAGNGSNYGKYFSSCSSFAEALCHLRLQSEDESALASVACLHGLIKTTVLMENLIKLAKFSIRNPHQQCVSSKEESILANGILTCSLVELKYLGNFFMKLVVSDWDRPRFIEIFDRGGPAPGVGVGWGASGGGFWSTAALLAQTDAQFLCFLMGLFGRASSEELLEDKDSTHALERINSALVVCLIAGPGNQSAVRQALRYILQVPTLKYLNLCAQEFLQSNTNVASFGLEYKEEDYLQISEILASHFQHRWLSMKRRKSKTTDGSGKPKRNAVALEIIHEDVDTSNLSSQQQGPHCNSLTVEWAHQRLPLPSHWFLSPISTLSINKSFLNKNSDSGNLSHDPIYMQEVTKAGLFFILGIESISRLLPTAWNSPVLDVPLVWKLHSLSAVLLVGMEVLRQEKTKIIYESLQELYGQFLTEAVSNEGAISKSSSVESLRFQLEINDAYQTFIEAIVEQYAAASYGDMVYGRQVAIYLHRYVEAPVRLAAWNAVSNARVLELLPPLEKCLGAAEGYLEPIEENEAILEAYVKSWVSGALDRAATRGSVAFTLVLHHLSSYIFLCRSHKLSLTSRLVKSLLRDSSRKQHHEATMLDLLRYKKEPAGASESGVELERRFEILKEACEGNSSLTAQVERLKSLCCKSV